MTLALPGFRPRGLRPDLEGPLIEQLRFRHVYRNLYSFDLRWPRVRALAVGAVSIWADARADLEAFAAALGELASA